MGDNKINDLSFVGTLIPQPPPGGLSVREYTAHGQRILAIPYGRERRTVHEHENEGRAYKPYLLEHVQEDVNKSQDESKRILSRLHCSSNAIGSDTVFKNTKHASKHG